MEGCSQGVFSEKGLGLLHIIVARVPLATINHSVMPNCQAAGNVMQPCARDMDQVECLPCELQ